MEKRKQRPVMVTGGHNGRVVFFGFTAESKPDAKGGITLDKAQNCLRWRGMKGLSALATEGPSDACRVGPPVPRQWIADVRTIADCTPAAVKRWEAQPW